MHSILEHLGEANELRHQALRVPHRALLQQMSDAPNQYKAALLDAVGLQQLLEVLADLSEELTLDLDDEGTLPVPRGEDRQHVVVCQKEQLASLVPLLTSLVLCENLVLILAAEADHAIPGEAVEEDGELPVFIHNCYVEGL
jgi:hypothetical protein